MSRLVLLRHGQSVWNADRRWQGWADPALTAQGRADSEVAARHLARTALGTAIAGAAISSDLQRARETAEIVGAVLGLPAPVVTDHQLRELDVGEWSGLRREEIVERWPGWMDRWEAGTAPGPPGGELLDTFDARVMAACARWLGVDGDDDTRLVVAHGGVIRSLRRILGVTRRGVPNLGGVVVHAGRGAGSWSLAELPLTSTSASAPVAEHPAGQPL